MRKLNSNVYPDLNNKGYKKLEQSFINLIKEGKSEYPNILYGRIQEFSGIILGWVPNENDTRFILEDNYLSINGIKIADKFSSILTNQDPFYEYVFAPKGPAGIFPWILKLLSNYAISKGFDYIIEKLKEKESKELAKEISIDWGKDNGDSLGQIEIKFSDGSTFKIENYPHGIDRITIKQLQKAKEIITKTKKLHIIYNAWGRISAYEKREDGAHINIEI